MTPESSGYVDFLLSALRVAHVRARLAVNEIDFCGVSLRGGFMTADDALAHLHETGAMRFFPELTVPSS